MTTRELPKNISIRRIAKALNLNYPLLLKASKQPIEGEVYDPSAINYDAMDAYIAKRVDAEVIEAVDWTAISDEVVTSEPLPKEFEMGQHVQLRKDETIYEVVFMTPTHIVINPINDASNTTPRVMNNSTFLHQGPREVKEGA